LRHYSVHREKERVTHYVQFAVPKRSGGERVILAPKRELKAVLRALNSLLVEKPPVSEYAHGFRSLFDPAIRERTHRDLPSARNVGTVTKNNIRGASKGDGSALHAVTIFRPKRHVDNEVRE
jgi:hypothetical protein